MKIIRSERQKSRIFGNSTAQELQAARMVWVCENCTKTQDEDLYNNSNISDDVFSKSTGKQGNLVIYLHVSSSEFCYISPESLHLPARFRQPRKTRKPSSTDQKQNTNSEPQSEENKNFKGGFKQASAEIQPVVSIQISIIRGIIRKYHKKTEKPLQNAYRNILPNIIHQIFCFIQKRKRSGRIVEMFLRIQSDDDRGSFSIDRYYCYQRLIREKTNNYINMRGIKQLNSFQDSACEVYSQDQQCSFLRMNRILLRYFLAHQFNSIALTSTRMNSDTRYSHFQIKRKILDELVSTLRER